MEDGSRKEARDHSGSASEEEAPPEGSAAVWLDTTALRSQLVSRLGRVETLKYGGAPWLRETRPPSTSENSRHCQVTVQSDSEDSRAGDDAGRWQAGGAVQWRGGWAHSRARGV